MNYAALMDANDDIQQVIVIPEGEDATYCESLGLAGTWRHAPDLPAIGYRFAEGGFFPHWFQIAGAGTGPDGAESGFPPGYEVFHAGHVWRSTMAFNVFVPGVAGWHRKDGTWVQPSGASDAYSVGAEVLHNGQWWINDNPANPFAPGVAGWRLRDAPPAPVIAAWVQPTGAHNAYPLGARVTHNGRTWQNTGSPANVWAPGVFGWIQVTA